MRAFFCVFFGCRREGFALEGIDLRVEPGELIGVVGPVGSSKSSLLMAVLREMAPESLASVGSGANVVSGGRFIFRTQSFVFV